METKAHGGKFSAEHTPPEIFMDDEMEVPVASGALVPRHPSAKAIVPPAADGIDDDDAVFTPPMNGRPVADPWSCVEADPMTTPPEVPDGRPIRAIDTADDEALLPKPRTQAEIDQEREDADSTTPERGGGWTLPMLCAGIAIIAACLLVPMAEENHALIYQRERLKLDLAQVKKQVAVNDDFLKRINDDPTLAERLAQRQMKTIRQGEAVLDIGRLDKEEMSPFMLVTVPPPAPMPEYKPVGGMLASVTRYPRTRLFMLGGGLFLIMFGLVLGYSKA